VLRIFIVALSLSAMSCATIAHGVHETITIDSSPSGANVDLKCQKISRNGTTPAAIVIPRNATDCVATISKSDFKTKTVAFDRAPTRAYWLNFIPVSVAPISIADNSPLHMSEESALALLLFGIVGFGVDAFDGAIFKHEPSNVHVMLESSP